MWRTLRWCPDQVSPPGQEDGLDPDDTVERVLIVAAHPDDADFGAAGSTAIWTAAGTAVTYCIVTDGGAGGYDEDVPRADIPAIRHAEQRAAAAVVGVTDVHFLGYRDGELTVTHELRRDLARVIRRVRPQRMLIQSPERNWDRMYASHPDHMAAGEAAMQAIYPDARNRFAHPSLLRDERLEPWTVPQVFVMASAHPNHFVDVTDTFDRKVAALRAHVSQTAHMEDLEAMLRDWLVGNARVGGLPQGRLAEAFKVVNTA